MTLNNPNAGSVTRKPNFRVLLIDAGQAGQTNGGTGAAFTPPATNAPLNGAISVSATTNNYYQSDVFSAEFAIKSKADLQFWAGQPRAVIDIQMTLDGNAWSSILIGECDKVSIIPFSGQVSVNGRDLTARFIEAKTQETFANQTSSEVAQTLAARHGMTAVVTPTTTLVSRFYQDDYTEISLGQFSRSTTEWDLLTNLAKHEGFDCFVSGLVLYFKARVDPASTPWVVAADPYSTPEVCNVSDLRLERSLTLARDIVVEVRSWDSRNQRGFTKTAKAIGAKGAQAASSGKGPAAQRYSIVLPNLTEDQAQKKANSILHEMSKHERTISFHAPGDLVLSPRCMVQVTGTQTEFDQAYYVDSVARHISLNEGFSMDVTAKNRSADSSNVIQTEPGPDLMQSTSHASPPDLSLMYDAQVDAALTQTSPTV